MDDQFADGMNAPPTDSSQESAPTPQTRFQKRIDTVIAQREDALRALDSTRTENAELKARLESLEGRMSGFLNTMQEGQSKSIDRGIDKFSEQEILAMIQEEGITDPAVLMRGVKELARREATQASNQVRAEMSASQKLAMAQQQANQDIITDYPDALKSDSPLNGAAKEIAGQLMSQLKKTDPKLADGLFDRMPQLAWLVYAAASGRLGAQKVNAAQVQVDTLQEQQRQAAALEVPMNREAEAGAAGRNAVARGDWKSGLRSLSSIRALSGVTRVRPGQ